MNNNFNQLLKQAQQMQEKLMEAQNKMSGLEITGTSGGGMVSITINGKNEMRKVQIDTAAYNDAKSKLEAKMSEQMGGILPPGMKLPF